MDTETISELQQTIIETAETFGIGFNHIPPKKLKPKRVLHMHWIDKEKKMAFYKEILTSDEYTMYQMISALITPSQIWKKEKVLVDVMLFNVCTHSAACNYPVKGLMNLYEKFHPEVFQKYRLEFISGALESDSSEVYVFRRKAYKYINAMVRHLLEKIDHAMQTTLRSQIYELAKTTG
jgi:hypothetical protein